MRIVFCGTPEFGVPSLRSLLSDSRFKVEAVVTQPDRPRGRGQVASPPPIKELAAQAGVPVFQPEKIRAEAGYEFFERLKPDAVVIIAYGQIIPARLIAIPPFGWINLHASLLPKYRGAAPIAWAIANGETHTGLTTMQIDPGMDTGPMLLQHGMEVGPDETAPELARRMAEAGAPLMMETLLKLASGEVAPVAQDASKATYAPLLKKEDGRVDWSLSAEQIYNRIRGFAPWPGAYTTFRGQLCHIWGEPAEPAPSAQHDAPGEILAAAGSLCVLCGHETALRLETVQMEGRKRITSTEFANGGRVKPGERFG